MAVGSAVRGAADMTREEHVGVVGVKEYIPDDGMICAPLSSAQLSLVGPAGCNSTCDDLALPFCDKGSCSDEFIPINGIDCRGIAGFSGINRSEQLIDVDAWVRLS